VQVQKVKQGYKLVKSLFGKYQEIPEDWSENNFTKFDVKTASGGTPNRSMPQYYDGDILWVKSGELNDNFIQNTEEKISEKALQNSSAKIFPTDTVLIAMYGATIGYTGILKREASTNQAVCAIPSNDVFESFFLQQFLILKRRILVTFGIGSGQPNISQEIIKNFRYLAPPIHEQQKIVAVLSNVDALISTYNKTIESTKKLKTGLMKKLLTKGIGHAKFKKVKLLFGKYEEIPEEWNQEILKNVIQVKGRVGWKGYTKEDFVEKGKGAISLGAKNISKNDLILLNDITYVKLEKYEESPEIQVSKYDIILAQRGSIGKVALIDQELGKTTINPNVVLLTKSKINNRFLYYVLTGNYIKKQMISITSSTSVPLLTQGQIKNFKFLSPPKHEQEKITSILTGTDSKIFDLESKKSSLEILKKGLMQKLLTGELRVRV